MQASRADSRRSDSRARQVLHVRDSRPCRMDRRAASRAASVNAEARALSAQHWMRLPVAHRRARCPRAAPDLPELRCSSSHIHHARDSLPSREKRRAASRTASAAPRAASAAARALARSAQHRIRLPIAQRRARFPSSPADLSRPDTHLRHPRDSPRSQKDRLPAPRAASVAAEERALSAQHRRCLLVAHLRARLASSGRRCSSTGCKEARAARKNAGAAGLLSSTLALSCRRAARSAASRHRRAASAAAAASASSRACSAVAASASARIFASASSRTRSASAAVAASASSLACSAAAAAAALASSRACSAAAAAAASASSRASSAAAAAAASAWIRASSAAAAAMASACAIASASSCAFSAAAACSCTSVSTFSAAAASASTSSAEDLPSYLASVTEVRWKSSSHSCEARASRLLRCLTLSSWERQRRKATCT